MSHNYATEQAILNTRWNAAAEEFNAAQAKLKPSVLRNAKVFKDGNEWCCCLYWPEERSLMEQLVCFGKTPQEACDNFDKEFEGG